MLLVAAAGCELPWDCGEAASSLDTDQAEYISRGLATSDLYQALKTLRKSIQQQATDTFFVSPPPGG